MQPSIEVRGLRTRYAGTTAVDGLTFDVRPGEVTGFVGPNGAGKSTTMRLVLGLDSPDEGIALVCGRPYRTLRRPLTDVGALLDAGAMHPARKARDHLLWLAHSNGLLRNSRRLSVIDRPAAAMGARPSISRGRISDTLSTVSTTSVTPSWSAKSCTRSYSGPAGPSGPTKKDVGVLRVTTRNSPRSSTCSSIDGGDEQVPSNPAISA
jgi:ABC-type cobalamin/Fe3+-siderophores transport system ATPase subunit